MNLPSPKDLMVGLDVGSTTVKSVVVDLTTQPIVWSDYQRHDTKQPEKCLEFLKRMEADTGLKAGESRVFITGSGGGGVAPHIGAKFVQEVNAVSLAVEHLYPDCGSVVELGGQDAKIIIFKEDPETGRKKKIPSMNDKCAGGTGAVIDKINAKLRIPAEELCNMGYVGLKLHPVAGKCGVFAETDINGLQKSGVPPNELMASLFEAIIQQNLAVLTRGNPLRPVVLLLGGPNTYIAGMRDCWKHNIPKVWEERNYPLPEGQDPKDLIQVPENAQYFAALGCVRFGMDEDSHLGVYQGWEELEWYINVGRLEKKKKKGSAGLYKNDDELAEFKERYKPKRFVPRTFQPGEDVNAWKNSYSENTSQKIWAAKYTARHPNLVALELSSFKCGHDAPIYTAVEETVTKSGTPYFSFKDIDENKPTGSIKIRVETIAYFLKRYREDMIYRKQKQAEIDVRLKELEAQLRRELATPPLEGEELPPGPPRVPYEVETRARREAVHGV
jgi:activator of 2-hydroxyglutaryl-CoA dehydratase